MTHRHTVKLMRSSAIMPNIADRDPREVWLNKGALDTQARALQRAREILNKDNPVIFPPDVEDRIRKQFPGLVSGNSRLPEGW